MSRMDKHKKKKRMGFLPRLLIIVLIVILLTGFVGAFYPSVFFSAADFPAGLSGSGEQLPFSGANFLDRFRQDKINFVILGFDSYDSREGKQSLARPDSIIVASLDVRSAKVAMVSIPRDSYVQIHGTSTYDKINHSYMHGYYRAAEGEDPFDSALRTTLLTVRDFMGGVPLHGYIKLDMAGAEDIVDSIGGIYHEVEFDVRSDFGRGRVLVEEGYQLLDGKKFLHYVRNRADAQGGDRGRAGRQQEMMIVLLDQITEPRGIIRAPALYRAVTNSVEMDLNKLQLAGLGLFGLRVDPSEIESYVLGGRGQLSYRDGQNIYYLVIDEDYRVEVIEKVFGIKVDHRAMPTLEGPMVEDEPEEPEPDPEIEPEEEADQEPVEDPEPGQDDPVEEDPEEEKPVEEEPGDENGDAEEEPVEEEPAEEDEEPAEDEAEEKEDDDNGDTD